VDSKWVLRVRRGWMRQGRRTAKGAGANCDFLRRTGSWDALPVRKRTTKRRQCTEAPPNFCGKGRNDLGEISSGINSL
jgi:hypothetical protein